MANPELGTKRLCASCGARFYDLNKVPIHCPKCGAVHEIVGAIRPVRPAGSVTARPPIPKEALAPQPVETVSPGLADAESPDPADKTAPAEAGIEEEVGIENEEVEMDNSPDDDDTLMEEQEEEDADVTDIIGDDIENKEEG